MKKLFEYNWQVRDEWFHWCNQLPLEELLKARVGGPGSILYTLFHIVDVEYSWLRGIIGKEDIEFLYSEYNSLEMVRALSETCRNEILDYLRVIIPNKDNKPIRVSWDQENYTKDEILHHIIAHEIHHIGQLSVWARELNLKPITANFIGRSIQPRF
ncbi:DinB family protein [Bacillus salitolerans]|uniref:DinB family protein n=1 Tax=Bacillus salitolerans TaxID=1437434 RepID=A0ABW4LMD6_9BACI